MADPQHDDFAVVFVDSVEQSICSASCAPDAFQLTSQRTSLLTEQAIILGAGVVTGGIAGIGAALVALPRIPQFTTTPASPPLTYTPEIWVVVAALAISAGLVAVVVVSITEALRRSGSPEQLRQTAPP